MGYKLYRELLDFAPQDWTSGELVVAWVIADDARDNTRRSYITPAELSRRSRMGQRGVREALERLSKRGYEFRVGHGKGKDGREMYAVKGRCIEYQVPDILAIAAGLPLPVDNQPVGGTTVPPNRRLSTG